MKENYAFIDWFRLPAALMVIAIHTAPFSSLNPELDTVLTYGIGRVAVPFFLMTTGYFVLAPYVNSGLKGKCAYRKYMKKTLLLYGISILLYVPVMCYAGQLPENPGALLKMLIFDGTFYHLWYFPAVLLGSVLTVRLLKRGSVCTALTAAALLYLTGLFGDSYYGIAEQIPAAHHLYEGIFSVSSYTRNGIFYAPLFLLLGSLLRNEKFKCEKVWCRRGTIIGLALLALESSLTESLSLQRHNSMYFFLPVTMYFLYQLLLTPGKAAPRFLRAGTAFLYVIHPMGILLVRILSKLSGAETLLVENSLVHYSMVCLVSLGMMAVFLCLRGRGRSNAAKKQSVD